MCICSHFLPFLAFAASTLSLQADILADCACSDNDLSQQAQSYLSDWHFSGRFATKITLLGSSRYFDRRSSSEIQLDNPGTASLSFGCFIPHSGDWLQAMSISSCGLRLDDEAVRIGVGLRLGLSFCVPHKCHRGALVDAQGLRGFVCEKAPGRPTSHHALSDLVARAMVSASIPCTKEPLGLSRSDGKRSDGLFLVLWEAEKLLT